MHRDLKCGGFQPPYDHLCKLKRIDASWLTIAKNMMCLEAEHVRPFSSGAIFCACDGFMASLSMFRFDLKPRPHFVTSPTTRLGRRSWMGGEAFTRWFAQSALKASHVLQWEVDHSIVATSAGTRPAKGKPGAPAASKKFSKKRRPDFAAFTGSTPHILESKGTAGRRVRDTDLERKLADALVQVSTVGMVSGLAPATRTGCSFGFDLKGVRGTIWDPPEVESFDIEANLSSMIQSYYAVFPPDAQLVEFEDGFIGYQILDGVRLSVDKSVLSLAQRLRSNEEALAFFDYLQERRDDLTGHDRDYRHTGPDGIRLEVQWELLMRYERLILHRS